MPLGTLAAGSLLSVFIAASSVRHRFGTRACTLLVGHPSRISALETFLDFLVAQKATVCRRIDVARYWYKNMYPEEGTCPAGAPYWRQQLGYVAAMPEHVRRLLRVSKAAAVSEQAAAADAGCCDPKLK